MVLSAAIALQELQLMLAFVLRHVSYVRGEVSQPSLRGIDDPGFQYYHRSFLPTYSRH